jgi:DNA-binding NtrC family response regulator
MNGFETKSEIQQIDSHAHVILMSGYWRNCADLKATEESVIDVIAKPVNLDRLALRMSLVPCRSATST